MANRPIAFPQEDPTLFKTFLEFLTTGTLRHVNLREQSPLRHFCRFLAELYGLASFLDAHEMRNAIIDVFFMRIYCKPSSLPWESIREVYDNTRADSSLRDLTIHMILNLGTPKKMEIYEHHLPRTFLVDCLAMAAEDGTVPFQADIDEWLDTKKKYLCQQYHVHDEEAEHEEGEGEGDEADAEGGEGGNEDEEMGSDEGSWPKYLTTMVKDFESTVGLRARY
jgi:hypothetical protein